MPGGIGTRDLLNSFNALALLASFQVRVGAIKRLSLSLASALCWGISLSPAETLDAHFGAGGAHNPQSDAANWTPNPITRSATPQMNASPIMRELYPEMLTGYPSPTPVFHFPPEVAHRTCQRDLSFPSAPTWACRRCATLVRPLWRSL